MQEEHNKIEDIKRKLYDPNDKLMSHQREGILHPLKQEVSLDWKEDDNKSDDMKNKHKKAGVSIYKKFFIVAVIFFIGAIGFSFLKFSNNTAVSSDNINIDVIGNAFTKGGDELSLQIEITNKNNSNLELANLIIEYPKGAEDNITDVVRLPRDSIGTIKPGEVVIRNIKVKLFGTEKSIRNIKVRLEYHPAGSNAIFTKDKIYPVTISLAPLSLNIDAPSSTTSNQQISMKITASLNTSLSGENSVLQLTYPNNFIFDSAIPAPILGNSIWGLSEITNTKPVEIEIQGRLIGEDGDEQVFHVYAGTTNDTNKSAVNVVYTSLLQKIAITKPFLDARILVNGEENIEYSVANGESVNAQINWSNNLSTRITDGEIIVSLSGNVFDKNTVKVQNGFYDSSNNQIIWNKNTISQLSDINPGDSGNMSFSFTPTIPSSILSYITNPQVSIKVSIKGKQPQLGSTFSDINNFSEKIVKISSDFQIAQSASYSSGSIVPQAETETSYTINWTLSNTINSIKDAEARSTLPVYIKWVGISPGSKENIIYNDVTREIIWKIGQVAPNTGINSNKEVSFIVSIKPSVSQVGSVPQLVKNIFLSGMDTYTNKIITNTSSPLTTFSQGGGGKVIQ
jgi:hypothetical protein